VINTQDVFHGALAPAGLFPHALPARRMAGRTPPAGFSRGMRRTRGRASARSCLAILSVAFLLVLLGAVALGYFYAVEAAAHGRVRAVRGRPRDRTAHRRCTARVLTQAMATSGALFALLIAATTLTLVLRILGTDKLVADWVTALPGSEFTIVAIVLGAIGLSAFVLDAFEIIFVIVPIVIPPLLIRVADARWVAVLVLLTLQTSFLLPPFGYALMMVRGTLRYAGSLGALTRALFPFLLAQWLALATVLLFPQLAHLGEKESDRTRVTPPVSAEELNRRLEDMLTPIPELVPPK
jgi:TRAP-type mannitol/chloroaromatic compound transport system permease large subunit